MRTYQDALTALADPTRRAIYDRLRQAPSSVGSLALDLPVTRPAVSQHLKVLREARLVRARREGTRNVYSLDPAGLVELRQYVDSLWNDVLRAFRDCARPADQGGDHDHPGGPHDTP